MLLKEIVMQAFGENDEECVARFLREKLNDCNSDTTQQKLLQEKYKKHKTFHKEHIPYDESMKENYPHYDAILEYLMQNTKQCDVVRVNSDEDNVIWYFAKDIDSFYVTYISDCM